MLGVRWSGEVRYKVSGQVQGALQCIRSGTRWSGKARYKVSGQVHGGQVKPGTRYQVRYKVVR